MEKLSQYSWKSWKFSPVNFSVFMVFSYIESIDVVGKYSTQYFMWSVLVLGGLLLLLLWELLTTKVSNKFSFWFHYYSSNIHIKYQCLVPALCLSKPAKICTYLSIPETSVPPEWIFIKAGQLISERGNSLKASMWTCFVNLRTETRMGYCIKNIEYQSYC